MNIKIKEAILDILAFDDYIPLTPAQLFASALSYGDFDEQDFWRTLYDMEQNYDIGLTKKGKVARTQDVGIFRGVFSASSRGGFGFVTCEQGEFFIPPQFTKGALNGDSVAIKKIEMGSKFYGKGNEAEVIKIISRATKTFVGTFKILLHNGNRSLGTVIPDNEKIKLSVTVKAKDFGGAVDGDKVVCSIISYPENEFGSARVEIIEILGETKSRGANYKAILYEHGIVTEFDDAVLREAAMVDWEVVPDGRCDLRSECIFTIDGADAKDLDDAISVKKTENGYTLGVHIADVSHYVTAGSKIDEEAFNRGTSVYFTDKVVPMLPKELSNGICSLNGGVDRYALSCIVSLDKNGEILGCDIKKSIINSKVRGVYSELNDIIENGENSEFYSKYEYVLPDFKIMLELYEALKKKSIGKGAMELESEESKIILDKTGHPIDIIKRERGISERLIEQFMLCANESVAMFLYNAGIPCVYRVHDEPDPEKIRAFALFARNLGADVSALNAKNTITSKQLASVLECARDTRYFSVMSGVLLRSLMKARYSSIQKPHFGLATEFYCHFTSPIRRYPDLSVHRIITALLEGKIDESNILKYEKFAEASALASSENELRATYAEREIDELYKCVYMQDKIGAVLDCVICSVTSFGFFARTENLCEGLVPIEALGNGFFYDKDNYILARGKTAFKLGQAVRVKVVDVDILTRRITFSLLAYEEVEAPKIDITKAQKVSVRPKSRSNYSRSSSSKSSHSKSGKSRSHSSSAKGYSKKKKHR